MEVRPARSEDCEAIGRGMKVVVDEGRWLATPEGTFRFVVPFLILMACSLLLFQDRLRAAIDRRRPQGAHAAALPTVNFGAAVYGGYFGAGLGIMMLAVLGILVAEPMRRLNALKSTMALIICWVSASAQV